MKVSEIRCVTLLVQVSWSQQGLRKWFVTSTVQIEKTRRNRQLYRANIQELWKWLCERHASVETRWRHVIVISVIKEMESKAAQVTAPNVQGWSVSFSFDRVFSGSITHKFEYPWPHYHAMKPHRCRLGSALKSYSRSGCFNPEKNIPGTRWIWEFLDLELACMRW
jgi:hypothetical protein